MFFEAKHVESMIGFHIIDIYVCMCRLFSENQYAQKIFETRWLHPSSAVVKDSTHHSRVQILPLRERIVKNTSFFPNVNGMDVLAPFY
jgi:hypothetical protein